MLEMLSPREKDLMTLLLKKKSGLDVEELADQLGISKSAVHQRLIALENQRLVKKGQTLSTGGRPKQLFMLAEKGYEYFPRQYSWFAELLVSSLAEKRGAEGAEEELSSLGKKVGQWVLGKYQHRLENGGSGVEVLIDVMNEMGYIANSTVDVDGAPIIEAENCIFLTLATKSPHVCSFDIAIIATVTGSAVDHQECMVKNGNVCRFKLGAGAIQPFQLTDSAQH